MTKPLMTPARFDALRPNLGRLATDTVEIARTVLVDGMSQADVAARYRMTPQRIHGIMKRFQLAARAIPAGWRHIDVWLPPNLADQVEAMEEKARAELQPAVS